MAKLFICGDLLNSVTEEMFLETSMLSVIQDVDYAICNFEAPVESCGTPIKKVGPHKQQKKKTIELLKSAGFNLLLLANNHMFDYGVEGLKQTLKESKNREMDTIGANVSFKDTYSPTIKDIDGLKFGFINASEAQFGVMLSEQSLGGYAWINHPRINQLVVSLKKEVDFVIFFAHAGLEGCDIPLIEWRERYKELCDLGVNCLIASHPHVPQGYETYKDKQIFYSLGNFYFPDIKKKDKCEYGFSLVLDFEKGSNISIEIIYHKIKDYKMQRISEQESTISFTALSQKLEKDYYEKNIKNVYTEVYNDICYEYYASVFEAITEKDSITTQTKKVFKQLFFKNRNKESRDLLLLHLNKNETYRYITQRALEIKLFE